MNAEPVQRVCPACQGTTLSAVCPRDGTRTVVGVAPRDLEESPEALVGTVFDGRYRVEALLGKGGMGTVYRANQLSIERAVALKILNPGLVRNPDQVRRFYNEARAASLLEHPHTIRLYDFGQAASGHLYHVTELLDGEALSALIERRGRLPLTRTLSISQQILRGLADAHAHGIVHRDLKPENIFLQAVIGEGDFIKVLDFGIAKIAPLGQGARRLTQVGTVVGTPLYMSPEQARGLEVDARSDLYSLGAVMFEMLVGAPPFVGENAVDIMLAHVQEVPPPVGLDRSPRDRAASALIAQLLAKTPGERPESAEAVRVAIEAVLALSDVEDGLAQQSSRVTPLPIRHPASITIEAVPERESRAGRIVAAVAAVLVVVLGSLTAWFAWSGRDTEPPAAPTPAVVRPAAPSPPPRAPAIPSLAPERRDGDSAEGRRPERLIELAPSVPRADGSDKRTGRPRPTRPSPRPPVEKPTLKVDKK